MEKSGNKTALIIAVIVLVLGVGAAVYALSMNTPTSSDTSETASSSTSSNQDQSSNESTTQSSDAPVGSTVIVFTNDGFNPEDYTSKLGEAVTVRNDSSMDVEFSSDDHPTHRENPELNLDVLKPGESATFTPKEAKTYSFHDHINANYEGTITVRE